MIEIDGAVVVVIVPFASSVPTVDFDFFDEVTRDVSLRCSHGRKHRLEKTTVRPTEAPFEANSVARTRAKRSLRLSATSRSSQKRIEDGSSPP